MTTTKLVSTTVSLIGKATLALMATLLISSAFMTSPASAANNRRPDLQTTISAPASIDINTPTVYTIIVDNIGTRRAKNVSLVIDMPLTNTSPTVHILGDVSGLDPNCSVANNQISCSLGHIRKNRSKSISYTFAAPVASVPLTMTATAAAQNNEPNTTNNSDSTTPNLAYPNRPITSTVTVNNSHCTGTGLTSYYECQLFPSSISSHTVTLNNDPGKTITLPTGFTGTWNQPTPHQLQFEYSNINGKVLEFNGYAINSSDCFDGITDFFQPVSSYNSAYRVCL